MNLLKALDKAVKEHRIARDAEVAARRIDVGRVICDPKLVAAEELAWKKAQRALDVVEKNK